MALFDYQTEGVNWMLIREHFNNKPNIEANLSEVSILKGGILADEVGLGKTLQTISVITQNKKMNTLILCPKSLLNQWKAEFKKFAPYVKISSDDELLINEDSAKIHVHINSHSKLNSKNVDIENNMFSRVEWDRIVIDEAHVIRNKRSKLHKACSNLRADIKWALSATPVMNKMTDFVHTLQWIGVPQDLCQNYTESVVEAFTKRRTKEDVSEQNETLKLPECHIENVKLNFASDEEHNLYIHVYNEMREKILAMAKTNNNTIKALELLLRVRQLCCHPASFLDGMKRKYKDKKYNYDDETSTKLENIVEDIKLTPEDDKCLVFCHFIKEMDKYCDRLKEEGFDIARLDGSMDNDKRQYYVNKFNKKNSCKVMVIQVNTGGVGYNFQVANRVYITSPTWNPSLQHQVIGRAHRTGQNKEVFVKIYSISSGKENETYIEDYIIGLQNNKLKMISEVLGDPRISTSESTSTISFGDVCKMFKTELGS